jgi:hypothetical protein
MFKVLLGLALLGIAAFCNAQEVDWKSQTSVSLSQIRPDKFSRMKGEDLTLLPIAVCFTVQYMMLQDSYHRPKQKFQKFYRLGLD